MNRFKSGHRSRQAHYASFQPSPIHRAWILDDMELIQLLEQADRELGRLDMHSDYIPNLDLFIRMHVMKDAMQSSRTEGTQTNIDDALRPRKYLPPEKRNDWAHVRHHASSINN